MSNPPDTTLAALQGKIKHVVFIIKENHTFDNYFGTYPGAYGMALPQYPIGQNQPGPIGRIGHAVWKDRAQRGVAMQFTRDHIPAYWSYADEFSLCDNFFTAVGGPSWPNHFMYITADSPIVDNPVKRKIPLAPFVMDSLPIKLGAHTWKLYYGEPTQTDDYPIFTWVTALKAILNNPADKAAHIARANQFDLDCQSGQLPEVSWLYGEGDTSEHPPLKASDTSGDVRRGSEWTAQRIDSLIQGRDAAGNSYWDSTAVFISWDDWGGWLDHSASFMDEAWSDPKGTQPKFVGEQFRRGSRVPCLVLSPYARKGYISKQFHTQVSLVRFCVELFGLQSFTTAAYTAADNMLDCFDASQAPLAAPSYVVQVPFLLPIAPRGPSLAELIDGESEDES